MPVRKRLALEGNAYAFITTAVREWRPVFENPRHARIVLNQLHETSTFHELSMIAYVVMPSHVHFIARFPRIEQLSRIIQAFKSLSARRLLPELDQEMHRFFHKSGRYLFWRPRFDDVIITEEKIMRVKIEYIHKNPVKAGLAMRAEDFAFSSAREWSEGCLNGPLPIARENL